MIKYFTTNETQKRKISKSMETYRAGCRLKADATLYDSSDEYGRLELLES